MKMSDFKFGERKKRLDKKRQEEIAIERAKKRKEKDEQEKLE